MINVFANLFEMNYLFYYFEIKLGLVPKEVYLILNIN